MQHAQRGRLPCHSRVTHLDLRVPAPTGAARQVQQMNSFNPFNHRSSSITTAAVTIATVYRVGVRAAWHRFSLSMFLTAHDPVYADAEAGYVMWYPTWLARGYHKSRTSPTGRQTTTNLGSPSRPGYRKCIHTLAPDPTIVVLQARNEMTASRNFASAPCAGG